MSTESRELPERVLSLLEKHGGWQATLDYIASLEALANSRAQDSGGEVVCVVHDDGCHMKHCCVQLSSCPCGLPAAEQGDLKIDNPKGSPAKGDVPLCEKYGDGCNFPDCPCDVDDPLTQQPFKGECFADALDEDIKEARTPQPSDAQQASRASNPADAACDCAATVDGGSHSRDCSAYATPPTAQRHDEDDIGSVIKDLRHSAGVDGYTAQHRSFIHSIANRLAMLSTAHGTNCQSAKADGGAVAPAAVEAVAWRKRVRGTMGPWVYDIAPTSNPDIECQPLYTAPTQQRSEQVAVSAAVVARALVECPISLVAESRWEWIAKYINTALSKQVAGGGGVDALPEAKPNDDDPEGFNNGWNCCLSAVRKALSTQPLLSDQAGGSETEETDNG